MNRLLLFVALVFACSPVKGKPLLDADVDELEMLQLAPSTITSKLGIDAPTQLVAMGTFQSGEMRDVTPYATWSSSDDTTASVAFGLVTPVQAGAATITAAIGTVTTNATVTIAEPTLVVYETTNPQIDFWSANATGNVAPVRSISGAATLLGFGWAIVADPANNEIFVTGATTGVVNVFPLDGSGNIAPIRSITGSNTGLATAYGLTSSNDELYVAQVDGTISVFPEAGSGNIAPSRTITGSDTGVVAPVVGIAVHKDMIYVCSLGNAAITAYPTSGSGDVMPVHTLTGPMTDIVAPWGITFVGDEMIVTDESGTILVFPDDADGNVAPSRWIHGPDVGLGSLVDLRPVGASLIGPSISNNSVITVPLEATGDAAPANVLTGSATLIDSPRGVAVY